MNRPAPKHTSHDTAQTAPAPRRTLTGLGGTLLLLGLSVIAAWHTHTPSLIQLHPSLVPMQYNTALGFVFAGIALVGLTRNWSKLAITMSALVTALGAITAMEYLFEFDAGIDQLFMQHYITTLTSIPGRMAPSTALLFLTGGGALLLITCLHDSAWRSEVVGIIGALMLAFVVSVFVGYAADLQPLVGRSGVTPIALPTAFGHGLLAASLIAWASSGASRRHSGGLLAVGSILTLTLLLWNGLLHDEDERLQTSLLVEARHYGEIIDRGIKNYETALNRMAERWEQHGGTTYTDWEMDAHHYIRDMPGILAISWSDNHGIVRWTAPPARKEAIIGLDNPQEPIRARALATARTTRTTVISGPIALQQSGTGFLLVRALHIHGVHSGHLVMAIRTDAFLNGILGTVPKRKLALWYRDRILLPPASASSGEAAPAIVPLTFGDGQWSLHLWRDSTSLNTERSGLAWAVLASGLATALLVAILFWLWRLATQRAEEATRATSAQRDSATRIQAIMDNVVDGIITIDEHGLIESFNAAAERIFGHAANDVVGRNISMLMPEPYRSQHDSYLARYLASGQARILGVSREVQAVRKDGGLFPMDLAVNEIRLDGRHFFTALVRDITARQRTETQIRESEERFRLLFTSSHDAIMTAAPPDWHFTSGNPAAIRLFGVSDEQTFTTLGPWDVSPEYQPDGQRSSDKAHAMISKALSEGSHIFEWQHMRLDGHDFPTTVLLTRCVLGGQVFLQSTVRDISEQKKTERLKNEFISTVSHELRTPLTSIRGSLGLLASGTMGNLPDKAFELLAIAYKNAERLGQLIDDLLDIEKIASGKLKFQLKPQPLMPIVEQTIISNHSYGEQYGVNFRLTQVIGTGNVKVDAGRLQQVLTNLLSNAAKFSPRGETVDIAVEENETGYRITVTDHGPGIPESFQPHIFEKFSQADASDTRARGGTGLGLAISRELIERMHGCIGFESAAGHGTDFWVELPRHSADPDMA